MTVDIFDRMIAATDPTAVPDMIALIEAETDRAAIIKFRAFLIKRAKSCDGPPKIWLALLNRRIADLYRGGADPTFMNLHQLADALTNGFPDA